LRQKLDTGRTARGTEPEHPPVSAHATIDRCPWSQRLLGSVGGARERWTGCGAPPRATSRHLVRSRWVHPAGSRADLPANCSIFGSLLQASRSLEPVRVEMIGARTLVLDPSGSG